MKEFLFYSYHDLIKFVALFETFMDTLEHLSLDKAHYM